MNHINDVAFNAWNCLRGTSPSALLWIGVASVVVAFAVWQGRAQWERTRRFDLYAEGLSKREATFLKRQTRRRLQIALLAGVSGAFMLAGLLVPMKSSPRFVLSCWACVLLFGAWTCLLAVVDALSVWASFADERVKRDAEKKAIEYHVNQFRDSQLSEVARANQEAKGEATRPDAAPSEKSHAVDD